MSEATTEGRFCIDLPDSDAATALAGTGQSTLHRLETLTELVETLLLRSKLAEDTLQALIYFRKAYSYCRGWESLLKKEEIQKK